MILWWQAVLISLASAGMTGAIALLIQALQQKHDGTRQDIRLAAERAAREEQAIRKRREDRMGPVIEFLDTVKAYMGDEQLAQAMQRLYDENVSEIQNEMTSEEFSGTFLRIAYKEGINKLLRLSTIASMSAATLQMKVVIYQILSTIQSRPIDSENRLKANAFIKEAEDQVERYIVVV